MIPFNDLRIAHAQIMISLDKAVDRVRNSGIFLNGPEVEAFEEEWAAYCGQEFCVACASGTDAIRIVTGRLGKIVIPANSCRFTMIGVASDYECIIRDVDEQGIVILEDGDDGEGIFCMEVLLYGRLVESDNSIFDTFDACQAHGWKPPADSECCWSFYPTKNLGCFGDGGAITLDDKAFASEFRVDAREMHSRMSEINAAVLRTKLPHLDRWNVERAAIAEVYYNELSDWAEPACRHGEPTNHHIFAILVDRRDELKAHLDAAGIGTKIHYPEPLAELPGARRWCDRTLSLPMYPGLTPKQVQEVCDTIRTFR